MSKQVVIVGASFAGTAVALKLQTNPNVNITLIDKKSVFYNSLAAPRACIDDKFASSSFISLDKLFKSDKHKIINDEVASITNNTVTLKNGGNALNYDYLIIASGCQYGAPFKLDSENTKEEGLKTLSEIQAQIKQAKKILIVGGGPVGIETAGEIKFAYPDKELTLVHSHEKLINGDLSDKIRNRVKNALINSGVKLVLGEKANLSAFNRKIVSVSTEAVETDKGTKIEADLVIVCVGIGKPNSSYLPESLLNEQKFVKVKPTLQVQDAAFPQVFALGDVADTGAAKKAFMINFQAPLLASNITNAINNKPLKDYKPAKDNGIFLSYGPKDGYAELPFMFGGLTDFLVKKMKSPDLMNGMKAKEFNAV